ncbi:MAG TPA: hypothetical protein VFP15_10810 [Gemmatimonadaceae bacterium]|nr:hypothetical protein [Gemmatimonadaceae bacterium]
MAFLKTRQPIAKAVLYELLVEHVKATREEARRGMSYSHLTKSYYNLTSQTLYPGDSELAAALAGIHDDCIKAGLPPIDVALWTKNGRPSSGYRNLAGWREDWDAVLAQETWPHLYEN